MMEFTDHPARACIDAAAKAGSVVEYVILHGDGGRHGLPEHRLAAEMAMLHIAGRYDSQNAEWGGCRGDEILRWDTALASASPYPAEDFFALPEDQWFFSKKPMPPGTVIRSGGGEYALAFLDPPYRNALTVKDWQRLNRLLFSDPSSVEIYAWSDNWSNFFAAGKEWWGTYFWTVYDGGRDCFVVVAASATD